MVESAHPSGPAGRKIDFESEDGSRLAAYLSMPPVGRGPGLLLLSDEPSFPEPVQRFCDALAEDGYVVLAPDLSARFGTAEAESMLVSDVRAALLTLAGYAEQGLGAGFVGFGRGGGLAFQAAAVVGAEVVIAYDALGSEQQLALLPQIACPVVLHFAKDNPHGNLEPVRKAALRTARCQLFIYEGCAPELALPGHHAYSKLAARVAYSRTLAPLRRELGPVYDLAGLLWEHLRHEFEIKDVDATMDTMVETPYVNHIPTMTGGVGHDELKRFYKYHFIPKQPKDRQTLLVSETVGADTVVLELISRFTHTHPYDHWLPGVPPTGKYCEVPVVVIAKFRGGKLYNEHIYWDHASLLAQLGLIDQDTLPVAGLQGTKKLLDEALPSNTLMPNWHESEGKPL